MTSTRGVLFLIFSTVFMPSGSWFYIMIDYDQLPPGTEATLSIATRHDNWRTYQRCMDTAMTVAIALRPFMLVIFSGRGKQF
jgi:hypothetical protein